MPDDNSQQQNQNDQAPGAWLQQLPEDVRLHPSVLKFKGPDQLAKSYIELEKMMGSRITLPDFEKGKPEEVEEFLTKWGRPGKADGYEYSQMPEGLTMDETFGTAVKGLAHQLGLNKAQFAKLEKWGIDQSQGMMIEQQKAQEKVTNELRAEWGFGYNDNVEKAHKTLAMLVGYNEKHPFLNHVEKSGLGNDPAFLKFMLDVSERFSEDKLIDTKIKGEELTRENARKKINEMRADKKNPYWNEMDPRHKDAVKEMNDLYAIAHPNV
jgi:hypothetical protein